jgi:predicted permease
MASLAQLFRRLLGRREAEHALQREMEHHLALETEANLRAGLPPEEARLAALRAFGGVAQAQEECRDAWGVRFADQLRQDAGYALRGLRHNPGYAAIVVLTLALGIGANTAIFSVVQGVLLRPLAYADPGRILMVNQSAPGSGQAELGFSVPEFMDYRERNRSFSAMSEYHSMWFILLGRPEPVRVQTGVVSDNFFDLLGVKPLHGRTFAAGEDKIGAAPVLLLSYEFWQSEFGGDPGVVGRVFEMNNKPHTVVGVLPPLPAFPNASQVYMPASACPFRAAPNTLTNRTGRIVSHVFARLRDGVTAAQAADDSRRIGVELCGEFPESYPVADRHTVGLEPVARAFTGDARTPLFVLLATSGFVLLIACANVANLSLARLVRRDRELAVRAALGAGRARILRQLLTENLLLAGMGGLAGLALAAIAVPLLVRYTAQFLPRAGEITINGPVLLFALAVSVLTGLVFGSRVPLPDGDALANALKDGSRGTGGGRSRLRAALVVGQVAVSVPLLVGAGLALRSLQNLHAVDPGLETSRVLAANVSLNWSRYQDFPTRYGYWERAMQEAAKLAGVQAVALTGKEPLNGLVNFTVPFQLEGQSPAPGVAGPRATPIVVSEDYFQVIGQPLLRGRAFQSSDAATAPPVVIVNQAFARRHWPAGDPVGRRLTFDNGKSWATIVGVVADTLQQLDQAAVDEIYTPLRASGGVLVGSVLVRTSQSPGLLARQLRSALLAVDAQQPVTTVETLLEVRDKSIAPRRLVTTLLGLFALLALGITAAGIGGVLAFSVSQRTREIGIRMALGASRGAVLAMVLRQGLTLVLLGLGLGTVGAWSLSHLMGSVLFGVPPNDGLTFVAVVVVLLAVAAAACLLPARRATAVRPVIALRSS